MKTEFTALLAQTPSLNEAHPLCSTTVTVAGRRDARGKFLLFLLRWLFDVRSLAPMHSLNKGRSGSYLSVLWPQSALTSLSKMVLWQ
jgi:hypothetical protein